MVAVIGAVYLQAPALQIPKALSRVIQCPMLAYEQPRLVAATLNMSVSIVFSFSHFSKSRMNVRCIDFHKSPVFLRKTWLHPGGIG